MKKAFQVLSTRKGETFDFFLLELALRLLCLLPCMFLLTRSLKWLALLSPVLFLFVLVPMRQNAAEAMQDAIAGGNLFGVKLVSFKDYGKKLARGIKVGLFLILWALLFLGVTLFLYRVLYGDAVVGQTDVFSVLLFVQNLGGGDLVRGAGVALMLYVLTLVPFLVGLGFHSGNRHAKVLGVSVRGHRGMVLKAFFKGCLLFVPFILVSAYFGADYVRAMLRAINNLGTGGLKLPSPDSGLLWIGVAFVVLVLPILPLRSMTTAVCVKEIAEEPHAA